jgi:hypothetical protein
MIYLASPFTHDDPVIRLSRVEAARLMVEKLMFQYRLSVFSPVVYGWAVVSTSPNLPTDFSSWRILNDSMIYACSGVFVLEIGGWKGSAGIEHELRLAQELNKPITFIHDLENPIYGSN